MQASASALLCEAQFNFENQSLPRSALFFSGQKYFGFENLTPAQFSKSVIAVLRSQNQTSASISKARTSWNFAIALLWPFSSSLSQAQKRSGNFAASPTREIEAIWNAQLQLHWFRTQTYLAFAFYSTVQLARVLVQMPHPEVLATTVTVVAKGLSSESLTSEQVRPISESDLEKARALIRQIEEKRK